MTSSEKRLAPECRPHCVKKFIRSNLMVLMIITGAILGFVIGLGINSSVQDLQQPDRYMSVFFYENQKISSEACLDLSPHFLKFSFSSNPKYVSKILWSELPYTPSIFIWITVRLDFPIWNKWRPGRSGVRHLYYFHQDVWSASIFQCW